MVKLDDSSDKIAEMTLRLLEAQAFSTVLQSQLSQSTSEAEAIGLGLREELRQTAAKLHHANIQLATLQADAEAREHELYVAKQALEERVQKLAETISEMERDREATKSENAETVRGFQQELDARRAETSQALTELEKERETLKAESAKAASEFELERDALLAETAKTIAELEQERDRLKDDMTATQLQLAELQEVFDLAKAKGDKSSELEAELESTQAQLKAIDQMVTLNLPLVDKQTSQSSVHAAFDLVSDELFDLIESLERDLNKPISRNLSNERKPLEASLNYLKRLQAELANRVLENQDRAHELKARLDAQIAQTAAANQIARQLEGTILNQANENGRLAMQLARQSDALSIAQSALTASQNEQRRLVIELELSVRRAEASGPARSAPSATDKQQVKQRQFDALQVQLKQAEMRSSTYTHQINELQNSLSRALHDIEIQQLELGTLRDKVAPAPTRPTADDLASIERIMQLEASLAQATARLESVPWGTVEMFRRFQRWIPSRVQSLLRRLRKV
ncbi:hypothetical protein [Aquidulcibacter sp.]|uniref:hypothetical protein n=1 Tax=Aquidulcibacter sp. TaxID=2052990 RepID=UPI0025C15BC1|nr:hypothetical protein [Aquidulcibacter sp.]MCA3695823.1 hypothetical protein [Aquidulcibacter sp.]